MEQALIDAIDAKLSEVDELHDENWVLLGEKLQTTILEKSDAFGAFTDEQRVAVIAVCRETYHAAAMTARVYAMEAILAYDAETSR